jgi:hypothetical protein
MTSEPSTAGSAEQNFTASQTSDGEESLSPLEQEVLDEYARLLGNLNTVSANLSHPHNPKNNSLANAHNHPAIVPPAHPVQQSQRCDIRRSTGLGAEDEFGVYAVEGECV